MPAAAGNTICRWARTWLAAATQWPTRSLRARTRVHSAVVARLSLTRGQAAPVGAYHVGQHVGVELVVLVAGRAVPGAQVLQLPGWDNQHGQPGLRQRLDDRAVGAFLLRARVHGRPVEMRVVDLLTITDGRMSAVWAAAQAS
jgi:hypothetical protein